MSKPVCDANALDAADGSRRLFPEGERCDFDAHNGIQDTRDLEMRETRASQIPIYANTRESSIKLFNCNS